MRKIRSAVYFCFVVKNYKKDQNCYSVRYIFINKNSICEDEFMNIMIAFGIASIMLLLGMFLRAKVRFLQNLLLPSSIIAGIAGLLLLNAAEAFSIPLGVETNDFSSIVNPLFVIPLH